MGLKMYPSLLFKLLNVLVHFDMADKGYLQIIWLEPKTSIFVRKKTVDNVSKKRVKSRDKIEKDAIINVLYRKKYYKAKIVSINGKQCIPYNY